MTDPDERELAHVSTIVEDILSGLIAPGTPPEAVESMRVVLRPAVAAGYAAGQASRGPATPRLTMLADALRAQHQREQFGDCTEDGDPFPCRTIRALNIVVGAPEDEPMLTVDDVLGG